MIDDNAKNILEAQENEEWALKLIKRFINDAVRDQLAIHDIRLEDIERTITALQLEIDSLKNEFDSHEQSVKEELLNYRVEKTDVERAVFGYEAGLGLNYRMKMAEKRLSDLEVKK